MTQPLSRAFLHGTEQSMKHKKLLAMAGHSGSGDQDALKRKEAGTNWGDAGRLWSVSKSQLDMFASARVPGQESIGWERASSKQSVTFGINSGRRRWNAALQSSCTFRKYKNGTMNISWVP